MHLFLILQFLTLHILDFEKSLLFIYLFWSCYGAQSFEVQRFLYKKVLAILSDVFVSSVSKTEISFSPPTVWYYEPVDISVILSASDNESFADSVKGTNTLSNNESKSLSEPWVEATDEDRSFRELSCIGSGRCLKSNARSCTFVNLIGSTTTLAQRNILIMLYVETLRRQNEEIIC
jgi:hypothetical protein